MFDTAIAGSLPKPEWLAETQKLWPQWKAEGAALQQAKLDATLLWIKAQEDAGLSIIGDGEMSRQHFVHGFLEQVEGIDFDHKVEMGIRADRYKAMVPQVVSALKLRGRVHDKRSALPARAHGSQDQVHAARPDDHRRHRGRPLLRRPGEAGDGLRRVAEPGGAGAAGRRRGHHPVRRAGFQCLHGRGQHLGHCRAGACRAGLDLHDGRAHLLWLRHPSQHRLEEGAWARNGVNTRRSCRRWRAVPSSKSAWSACTRMCRRS